MEEWEDIKGFNGFFQVGNLGNIRSTDRSFTNKNGRRYSFSGKPLSSKVVKMDINFLVLTLMASYIVSLHIGSFMKPLLES